MECSHGELRFLNGSNGTEGTIEVCLNGVWGTVCDNYWSTNDAKVACKSLGLSDKCEYQEEIDLITLISNIRC